MTNLLLVMSGLPAAGKSVLCEQLSRAMPLHTLSSDHVRRELFPVRGYDPAEHARVYDELVARARSSLRAGRAVAIDATNLATPGRPTIDWVSLARELRADLLGVHLRVEESVLRRRLVDRASRAGGESEATVETMLNLATALPPPWMASIDAGLFSTEQLVAILRPLLDGRRDPMSAGEHFRTHEQLHKGAIELASDDDIRKQEWQERLGPIGRQLSRDRNTPSLLGRWGSSRAIDDITRDEILARPVLERLMDGVATASWPDSHAGVLHTYGYLLSPAWTPYGFKRDRWVNGDVAAVLGIPQELLGADPSRGTLLANLTACLDAILGRESALDVPASLRPPNEALLIVEEVHRVDGVTLDHPYELRTYLILGAHRSLSKPNLLIYTTWDGQVESYVTAFAVDEGFVDGLVSGSGTGEIGPRYNVSHPFGGAAMEGRSSMRGLAG